MGDRKYVPAVADLKEQTMKLRTVPGYLFWQVKIHSMALKLQLFGMFCCSICESMNLISQLYS